MSTKWLKLRKTMGSLPASETDNLIIDWSWKLANTETYPEFYQLQMDLTLLLSDPDSGPRVTRLLQAIEEMQNEQVD
jgi:hypothetical protein